MNLCPFTGDLFVFYLTLLNNAYYLTRTSEALTSVRVIVDCGGKIERAGEPPTLNGDDN